ncbi:MAG: hypothetical protein WBG70_17985 [Spirulinaceae cyanobacterium]
MLETIEYLIEVSSRRGLHPDEEKTVLNYLRSMNEEEAVEMLKYMVDRKSFVSTIFASRVLRSKSCVRNFFKYGVINADAQSIKKWLEFAINRLGAKSTIYLIEKLNNESNRLLYKAVYWFPILIPKSDTKSQSILNKLRDKMESS